MVGVVAKAWPQKDCGDQHAISYMAGYVDGPDDTGRNVAAQLSSHIAGYTPNKWTQLLGALSSGIVRGTIPLAAAFGLYSPIEQYTRTGRESPDRLFTDTS